MKKISLQHKKKILIIALVLAFIISVPFVSQATSYIQNQINIIVEVYSLIKDYHINNVDYDTLSEGAINGMIETLDDPYTRYFTEEEYKKFIADIDGTFTGIGIYIQEKDDYIVVQSPISGSPADEVGLKAGDLIIRANDIDMKGKSTEEAADIIRGEAGTFVTLTIRRDGKDFDVEVMRASIQLPSVESKMLTEGIGYLKIYSFSSGAYNDVSQNLDYLNNEGMNKLIIDLRGNPGGYLNAVLEISKLFIENGPVVYIKDNVGNEQVLTVSNGDNWNMPLVLLIDGGSASASEILAGALKDYDKAIIIGENSFGKGTVQNLIGLESGGYLKLTVNEYFTPHKNKMNGIGVKPDIEVLDDEKQLTTALMLLDDSIEYQEYRPILDKGWIKEADQDYIALKDMVHYFDGTIKWYSKERIIEISLGDIKIDLPIDSTTGLIIKNGTSYLSVEQLNSLFENLIITKENESLTIYNL